jgi:8-oxo-dGTP pyrophosphatase MutT (NUDIX family)
MTNCQVELPDGRTTPYGVVMCGGAVGILPFLDADTVLLVRQYRYIAGRPMWEMPKGGIHPGESIEAAAQRELSEETGYRAGRLLPISTFLTSKSVVDETAHLLLAHDLTPTEASRDETEFIEVRHGPAHPSASRNEVTASLPALPDGAPAASECLDVHPGHWPPGLFDGGINAVYVDPLASETDQDDAAHVSVRRQADQCPLDLDEVRQKLSAPLMVQEGSRPLNSIGDSRGDVVCTGHRGHHRDVIPHSHVATGTKVGPDHLQRLHLVPWRSTRTRLLTTMAHQSA